MGFGVVKGMDKGRETVKGDYIVTWIKTSKMSWEQGKTFWVLSSSSRADQGHNNISD